MRDIHKKGSSSYYNAMKGSLQKHICSATTRHNAYKLTSVPGRGRESEGERGRDREKERERERGGQKIIYLNTTRTHQ